jgi:hypothetical protein
MRIGEKVNVTFKTQPFVILTTQAGNFHKNARLLGVDPSVIVRSAGRPETGLREIQDAISDIERAWDLTRYQARVALGRFRIGYSAYIHSRLIPILESLNLPAPGSLWKDRACLSKHHHRIWASMVDTSAIRATKTKHI